MEWVDVVEADQVAPGRPHITTVKGREIGIFHEAGRYYAVLNFCPHAGAPVCRGRVVGMVTGPRPGEAPGYDPDKKLLRCPWHHWEFELETGQCTAPVRQRLKTYDVRVTDGRLQIRI